MRNDFSNKLIALTIGFVMISCGQEFDFEQQEQQASLNNAQQALGFYIPQNQDWVMTSKATATFTVKGQNDTNDTVYVFSNSPRTDGYGAILASAPLNGTTATISDFRIPQHLKKIFVGLKEGDGNMLYKYVDVEDGQINASYDFSTTAESRTRAIINEIGDPFTNYTANEVNAKYKTTIPSTAKTWKEMTEASKRADWGGAIDYNNLNNFSEMKLTTGTYGFSVWTNSRDIYIDGEVTLNVDGSNGMNQARIYLIPNAILHLNMSSYIGNLEIYVANNATLDYNASLLYKQSGGGVIFNRGTLNLQDNLQINGDAILYNEGTINGKNINSAPGENNPSFFYNFGSLNLSGDFKQIASANFYNEGTVTVGGLTEYSQIWWINKGHHTTKAFNIQASKGAYYNFCQLIVKDHTSLHDGQLSLMANSYMEAGTAELNNFHFNMGGNAGFNVKSNSSWGAQNDNIYQGFKATGENNYVRLGGITTVAAHKYSLVTEGKVFIGIEQLNDLGGNNPYYGPDVEFRENSKEVDFKDLAPQYNATDCGATWASNPPIVTPPTEKQTWTYAFEDTKTNCDFDLNDVVIQVKENSSDANKLDITLVAAGCEYDDYVYLGDTRISWSKGSEVHAALGGSSRTMINTGRGEDKEPVTVTIDKPSADFDFQNADFKIRAFRVGADPDDFSQSVSRNFISIVKEGQIDGLPKAPLGIAIPDKWKWPKERVNITNAYEGFISWGKQTDLSLKAEAGGWYQNPTSGTVYEE